MGVPSCLPGLPSGPCIEPVRQPSSSKSGAGGAVAQGDVGDGSGIRGTGAAQPQHPLTADPYAGAVCLSKGGSAVPP